MLCCSKAVANANRRVIPQWARTCSLWVEATCPHHPHRWTWAPWSVPQKSAAHQENMLWYHIRPCAPGGTFGFLQQSSPARAHLNLWLLSAEPKIQTQDPDHVGGLKTYEAGGGGRPACAAFPTAARDGGTEDSSAYPSWSCLYPKIHSARETPWWLRYSWGGHPGQRHAWRRPESQGWSQSCGANCWHKRSR